MQYNREASLWRAIQYVMLKVYRCFFFSWLFLNIAQSIHVLEAIDKIVVTNLNRHYNSSCLWLCILWPRNHVVFKSSNGSGYCTLDTRCYEKINYRTCMVISCLFLNAVLTCDQTKVYYNRCIHFFLWNSVTTFQHSYLKVNCQLFIVQCYYTGCQNPYTPCCVPKLASLLTSSVCNLFL